MKKNTITVFFPRWKSVSWNNVSSKSTSEKYKYALHTIFRSNTRIKWGTYSSRFHGDIHPITGIRSQTTWIYETTLYLKSDARARIIKKQIKAILSDIYPKIKIKI
jgi:hypothetical protein